MRRVCKVLMACMAVSQMAAPAVSQELANASVRIVVSGPAGGTPDIIARLAADRLGARLGQPGIVENKTGGLAAITSVQAVASAPPNGQTLLMANTSLFSIGPSMYKKPPYDPREFMPITVLATAPNILVVNAKLPVKTYDELIALLRANPMKYNFASGGVGTPMHLYGELIKAQAGVDFAHVPYRGSAPAIVDLLSNQVQFLFDQPPSILPHVQSGAFRAIAVASRTRLPQLPDVPTLAELGFKSADAISWFGLVAPQRTPPGIVEKLSQILQVALKEQDIVERLRTLGAEAVGSSPADMNKHIAQQLAAWKPLVVASGITVD